MAIQTHTLENGMRVLIEENHSSKVVSFNALIMAGSANETDDEAGICHVIEHMLFKGTPTRPAGTIARDVEAAGGDINAYTSIDQTVFYINMAGRFSEKGLEILADAIKNPLFDAAELEREKEVILEEIRREKDNPHRMVSEEIFHTSFAKHTYGRPIIGYPKTVKSFTRGQILSFYRRWYTPRNICFIVVGDFESAKMLESVRAHFQDLAGGHVPGMVPPEEPQQKKIRIEVKPMNIQSAYLAIGFHIPRITHPDVPSVDVLSHIMGGSESSRLEQEIREKQNLAHHIYAYAFTPKDPGIFVIGAVLGDADAPKTLAAIRREVERLKDEPVTTAELSRARIIIRSDEIYDRETVGGEAGKLATFLATAGSHEFERRYYQMLSDVSTESVREAARRYLDWAGANIVMVVPENSPWVGAKEKILEAISPLKSQAMRRAKAAAPGPVKTRLKNGVTAILLERHNLPIVSITAMGLGGTRFETRSANGVSSLMARTLTKGTESRSDMEIASEIEKFAGNIDGIAGRMTTGLRSEFLSEHMREAFSLFADVLSHPAFEPAEVTKERRMQIKAIKDQEDNLPALTFIKFLETLFPSHPFGLRLMGTAESVKKLGRSDLVRFHRNAFRARNVVLAAVGDLNPREFCELAEEMLADLPRGRPKCPRIVAEPRPTEPREVTVTKREKQQAHIAIGFQGTTFTSPDRYPLTVLNNILSGQGGRLFMKLRDKQSLAYAVSSVHHDGIEPGYLAVYIGTEPGKMRTAIDGIKKEFALISGEAVDTEELERSKQYIVGAYELDRQRNNAVAGLLALNHLYGLDLSELERYPQRIMKVTKEDVLKVAKKYITPKACTMAIIKPGA